MLYSELTKQKLESILAKVSSMLRIEEQIKDDIQRAFSDGYQCCYEDFKKIAEVVAIEDKKNDG